MTLSQQSNSPITSRGVVSDIGNNRMSSPEQQSPAASRQEAVSPTASLTEQVAALSIDHSLTETTQLTSTRQHGSTIVSTSSLATRGRAPVRDGGVEPAIAPPVRCINPASGMF
jgi:hypothetical protein